MPNVFCRNVILEFKGAYFLPINSSFKDLYKGGFLFGPELTVQLFDTKRWYGFASIEYFKKKGQDLGLADSTKLKLLPVAVGLKYFVPIVERADFYFGFGFQAANIRTKSRRVFVTEKRSKWGFGALGKIGTYIHVRPNFLVDLFLDYSFIRSNNFYGHTVSHSKSNVSSAIFGVALCCQF